MAKINSNFLFNSIASFYGLLYKKQKKLFAEVIENAAEELDILAYKIVLDVGCGTGALCSVLNEKGLSVTGIDSAEKMLGIARNKKENKNISFIKADILEGLPFDDNSFDISTASYVAHGLQEEERRYMYAEMSRVAKDRVIIHDYNEERSFLTTILEWLEGGDYFNFIKNAQREMIDCVTELESCFSDVKVVNVDTGVAWYICKPNE